MRDTNYIAYVTVMLCCMYAQPSLGHRQVLGRADLLLIYYSYCLYSSSSLSSNVWISTCCVMMRFQWK